MAKDIGAEDRAAAYWRQVARVDRVEAGTAVVAAQSYSAAARREDQEPSQTQSQRLTSGLRLG